jgi:hypothetical protein
MFFRLVVVERERKVYMLCTSVFFMSSDFPIKYYIIIIIIIIIIIMISETELFMNKILKNVYPTIIIFCFQTIKLKQIENQNNFRQ